jgi:diguanylate cyclase (GGDEF)-like protein
LISDRSDEIDRVTAAFTKESFFAQLNAHVARCRKRRAPLSILWVDVDEALELSDLHGRPRVDAALSWLAEVVSGVSDGRGPIGRVGEDELALALPGISQGTGLQLAEQVRARVEGHRGDVRITVSVGVAALRPNEPAGNLLDAAEGACMKAKQAGRNTVAGR